MNVSVVSNNWNCRSRWALLTNATSRIVRFHFLGRLILCSLALASAFHVQTVFVLTVFVLVFPLRMCVDLHWHGFAFNVMLCSRDLEDVFSRPWSNLRLSLCSDGVRFDLRVHPKHCQTILGIVVNNFPLSCMTFA